MPRTTCPECARSNGPNYSGPCDHGDPYTFDTDNALQFWGARGFSYETTGGNCDAFRLDYEDGRYILITKCDDPEAPEWTEECINVSLYASADHNETADAFDAENSHEAAETLDQLRAHDPQWADGEIA